MAAGEIREINNKIIENDLIKAGYIEVLSLNDSEKIAENANKDLEKKKTAPRKTTKGKK